MIDPKSVSSHYSHGGLLEAISTGVTRLGKTSATVTVEDLGAVDEFHIGGRSATRGFLDQLEIKATDHILDVGCGLGGTSRFAAKNYRCAVTGIDLTLEYIEVARELNSWVSLDRQITLVQASALDSGLDDASFDKAFMLHVGMNIADKPALMKELYRLLKPGGVLGIYDVMRFDDADLKFPVPWATQPESSAVSSPLEYKQALQSAGFSVIKETNRRDFASEFFSAMKKSNSAAGGPPPLGLHLVMGAGAPLKVKNMIDNIAAGTVAPVELIARK